MASGSGAFEVVGTGLLGMPTFAATPTIYLIAGLLIFLPVMALLTIFWTTGGVTFPFLKARLSRGNSHIVALIQKNGAMAFIPGQYKAGAGLVETPHDGSYFQTGEGVYYNSGVPISISYEDFGLNLTPEFVASCSILKNEGYENISEVWENMNVPEASRPGEMEDDN